MGGGLVSDRLSGYKSIGSGAMDVTKLYKSTGFGAMDVTKPYKSIGLGGWMSPNLIDL